MAMMLAETPAIRNDAAGVGLNTALQVVAERTEYDMSGRIVVAERTQETSKNDRGGLVRGSVPFRCHIRLTIP